MGFASDVDLLVILPFEGKAVAQSVEMRLKIKPPFPVDLLVRTRRRLTSVWRLAIRSFGAFQVEGKVLMKPITAQWVGKARAILPRWNGKQGAQETPTIPGRVSRP